MAISIKLLWEKINLSKEIIRELEKIPMDPSHIEKLCLLYERDHKAFYKEVLEKEKSELWFLYLYSLMACKTYDRYCEKGIPEEIFWDTFLDITYWCENYEREYGRRGLGAFDWFYRHMDMKLFRLGRLQFEKLCLEEEIGSKEVLKKGTEVINIHIPQGESLCPAQCEESLKRAEEFWGGGRPYVCHSWLLYPGLKELLPQDSNIRSFATRFKIIATDYKEREAEWRIFGRVERVVENYPENTMLQKKAKDYLLSGRALGSSWGIWQNKG